jgi:dienelactone hydrolase
MATFMNWRFLRACASAVLICLLPMASSALARERFTGPWDVEALKQAPQADWGETQDLVRAVYYAGEPLSGKPTRVFAWYTRPAEGEGPFPAMVLVHGGGGTAFAEWATLWAKRGYCALAMDLAGHGPDGSRLEDGGPEQSDEYKFGPFDEDSADQMWTYHAVAAVIRGHSLLASLPEVDPERIGITGISWGGYLTSIVAGIDDRLKVAVPVYGCGFLDENSAWLSRFDGMSPEQRQRWVSFFDPSRYLPGVSCPILFVNGTNDFAYPLDSYQKLYRLVPGESDLCVTVRMPHGHPQGWAPPEIGLYVDSVLKGGPPLASPGSLQVEGEIARASFTSDVPVVGGQLHYTADTGAWQERNWESIDATVADGKVFASLPTNRPLVFFLTLTDERGAVVSTEHAELSAE